MDSRVLLFFVALPCLAQWTQQQKEWALATSAVLNEVNEARHDLLATAELTPEVAESSRQALARSWSIYTQAEVQRTLDSLLADGQDKASIGWTYTRAVLVARWGYAAGYLTEAEAWQYIMPAAQRLQQTFSSWQDLGASYLAGRFKWNPDIVDNRAFEYAYRALLINPDSPWRKLPWDLRLTAPVAPSVDKTAELTIQSHPNGLTCVRVRLLNHSRDLDVIPVLEHVIGCHPQLTSQGMEGPDWILNAECIQPGALVGTQAVTHLHMKPFAEWLRAKGYTQVLYYVLHTPMGESALMPPSDDHWTDNNLQQYFGRRWLRDPFPDWTLTYGFPERTGRNVLAASGVFLIATLLATLVVREKLVHSSPLSAVHVWAQLLRSWIWTGWLVLSVGFQGFVIIGFRTGAEGLGADLRALRWYPLTVFAVRLGVEILLISPAMRRFVPSLSSSRLIWMSLWRVATELPLVLVLLILADSRQPLEMGVVVVLIALGGALSMVARHLFTVALDNRGASAAAGEFHDAVFEMATRLKAPLKRLYIVPDGIGVHLVPTFGSRGGIMIPEGLVRNLSRHEIDAFIAHTLLLIRSRYRNHASILGLISVLIGIPFAYAIQVLLHDPNQKLAVLMSLFGLAFLVPAGYAQIARVRTISYLTKIPGAPEAWIAAVAHTSRLVGSDLPSAMILRMAKRAGIAPQQMVALTDLGLPGGAYPVPDFDRTALVKIT